MPRRDAAGRGYDNKWLHATRWFKQCYPYCLGCQAIGLDRATDVVDHVIPHQGDQTLFWSEGNWQPACRWHHNAIKPILERQWKAKLIPDTALMLNSAAAIKLTKQKHRPAIGADGYPIAGT